MKQRLEYLEINAHQIHGIPSVVTIKVGESYLS